MIVADDENVFGIFDVVATFADDVVRHFFRQNLAEFAIAQIHKQKHAAAAEEHHKGQEREHCTRHPAACKRHKIHHVANRIPNADKQKRPSAQKRRGVKCFETSFCVRFVVQAIADCSCASGFVLACGYAMRILFKLMRKVLDEIHRTLHVFLAYYAVFLFKTCHVSIIACFLNLSTLIPHTKRQKEKARPRLLFLCLYFAIMIYAAKVYTNQPSVSTSGARFVYCVAS